MLRAFIFDMDGLLIDSEPLWRLAEISVFADVGLPLTDELCALTTGLRIDVVVDYWFSRHPWQGPSKETIRDRILDEVARLIRQQGSLKEGAVEALSFAQSLGLPIALASSSPVSLINSVLTGFNLRPFFNVVRSAEHESHGKPHPAVYVSTANDLGVNPASCLAIEDSLAGVIAAKAAQMKCCAVPEHYGTHSPKFILADAVLPSLKSFNQATVDAIVFAQ